MKEARRLNSDLSARALEIEVRGRGRARKDGGGAAAAYLRSPKRQFRHPVSDNIRTSHLVSHRPSPAKPRRAGPAFLSSSTKRILCTRSPAPRRCAHRPRTAAPARNCRVAAAQAKLPARLARPGRPAAGGCRHALGSGERGRGRGRTGSCPPLSPPPARASPAPPPSRSRVPRSHAAGHFAADATCPRSALQEAAVSAEPPKPA